MALGPLKLVRPQWRNTDGAQCRLLGTLPRDLLVDGSVPDRLCLIYLGDCFSGKGF